MNFSSNFFLKPRFFGFFRELNVRKFRKFSPDHFYDENFQFYDKKTDFRPGMEISSETTIPGISSETTVPGISSEPSAWIWKPETGGQKLEAGIVVSLEIPVFRPKIGFFLS